MATRGSASGGVRQSQARQRVIQGWEGVFADLARNDPGLSVLELAEKFQLSENTVRKMAESLVRQGKATRGLALRQRSDGRQTRVPVYQLK